MTDLERLEAARAKIERLRRKLAELGATEIDDVDAHIATLTPITPPAADLVGRVARAICAASFHPDDAPISWAKAEEWGDTAKWYRAAQAALTAAIRGEPT